MPAIVGTLTGPGTVIEGGTSTNFTIDNTTINPTYSGTLTMNDGGFGGTFTPTTLTWVGLASAKTFVYNAPNSTGTATITPTNIAGDSTAPSSLAIIVEPRARLLYTDGYTLSGNLQQIDGNIRG